MHNYTEKNVIFNKTCKILLMEFKLEVCVDSLESAVNAQISGASRIELCDNLAEGGTTPSFGAISAVRENLTIGVHVMIRPRGGDFLYNDPEYDIMRRDIEICGEHGVDGVVIGILRSDGTIDTERIEKLVELAYPMSVTFHRAYDMCSDPVQGLEDVISTGASRLLTSGHKANVPEGSGLISKLVRQAGSRIIIMPGSGLDDSNISEMAIITGATEFHLTARKIIESEMSFQRKGINMGSYSYTGEFSRKITDSDRVINIINQLKMI
jgi:copper homeostasis protein